MSWPSESAPGAAAVPGALLRSTDRKLQTERRVMELAYVGLGLPMGAAYILLIGGALMLGGLLGPLWIGLPVLFGAFALLWRCAAFERRLANRLLDARISQLPPLRRAAEGGMWRRVTHRAGSRAFWRGVALLALRLPAAAIAAAPILAGAVATVGLIVIGLGGITGSTGGYFGPFAIDRGSGLVLCLLAVPMAVFTVAVTEWASTALRGLARSLLVTSLPAGAPVRETLARSLGDRTLSIAYWLPDREAFVDERGHSVPLPAAGADRAWTAVDYEGRRVAAIVHDASLEASPELVQAAAAAASLALDNERLKADLRSRVEELRASRVRLVEASNAARRQIERNLHDGAQQQLVALAIELRLLRNRVGENREALELIDRIDAKLTAALDELRELARGIHPGILTARGLPPALESLAGRAPLPIVCEIDLPARPAASVEAVAYFVAAEALTNVLKYSRASMATIRAYYDGDELVIETEDDGVGGADERKGTGLQGLRDRVGALDGALTVISPPGGGTLVRACIPTSAADGPDRPPA